MVIHYNGAGGGGREGKRGMDRGKEKINLERYFDSVVEGSNPTDNVERMRGVCILTQLSVGHQPTHTVRRGNTITHHT